MDDLKFKIILINFTYVSYGTEPEKEFVTEMSKLIMADNVFEKRRLAVNYIFCKLFGSTFSI